jgi:2-oxoglutarate ferredoxin oxidoreductase subunit alpha
VIVSLVNIKEKMEYSILFGGKAGQGPNILSIILSKTLVQKGYFVFLSRDYQSLIRGGHNFNVLTFSDKPVYSNKSKIDLIIALDENTIKIHKKEINKEGIILFKKDVENMYLLGKLYKILGLNFIDLESQLKEIEKNVKDNLKYAKQGYDEEKRIICKIKFKKNKLKFKNGSQGISEGAIKSGLDLYYAYPMTPATSVLVELAEKQIENNHLVLELESEIAVINAGIGSAITGAKTMVGTSGGGFDLMTEALSLTGMAKVPLVIYLASRPGPSTGVATYTSQGDLDLARHSGHGEFNRMIFAPGNPKEAEELTNQAFYFSQKFKIPVIIFSDKHLAESFFSYNENPKFIKSLKSTNLRRYNSYEMDKFGCATENAEIIKKNVYGRLELQKEISKEAEKFKQFEIYGKKSKNIIVGWGSTKGAILDAIKDLNVEFLQPLYLEPFSSKIKKFLEKKNIILIENNSTAQLGKLIAEKTGIMIPEKNKILKYDGRPFFSDELKREIQKRMKK